MSVNMTAPLLGVLLELGSAIVHAQEYLSADGHPYDTTF